MQVIKRTEVRWDEYLIYGVDIDVQYVPGEPCGHHHIVVEGVEYRRPDTYYHASPFGWERLSA